MKIFRWVNISISIFLFVFSSSSFATLPKIKKVTIVGLGLIGGSIGYDLKKAKFVEEIIGVDVNKEHRTQAYNLGFVDQVYSMEKLQLAIKETDIVILAVPVNVIVEILPKILDVVSDTTTVMDVGSTKELICKVVANHVKRKQFVPSHPMAGTENSGPTAALQGLFNQKKVIICDKNQTNIEHLNRVKAIYSTLQSKLIYLSSKDHDRYIAYISHLSHVSSFALANTVLEQEDSTMIVNLAGGGFQSTVRLAKSSPEMWVPIFQQNKEHIIEAVDSYIAHLSTFRENIKSEDTKEIQKFLENGNKIKEIFK